MKKIILFFSFITISAVLIYGVGFRVNLTPSIPLGIYKISKEKAGKGKYVVFNPIKSTLFDEARERGYLKKGVFHEYMPLFKKICAVSGDSLSVSKDGVFVNGTLIADSKPINHDDLGRSLPHLEVNNFILNSQQVALIGESFNSFDSRYFGIVKRENISGVIKSVYVWSYQQ